MNKKYYIYSGPIIIILLLLVFINENKSNYYKKSPEDIYALLQTVDINISSDEINAVGSTILTLDIVLEEKENKVFNKSEDGISVSTAKLLDPEFLNQLEQHEGIIVIVTEDVALAVKSWVILTRLGVDNIKILDVTKSEVLNYSFEAERY